ncbi:hypothetical protein HPB50_010182 [Hyalomma asiaticum]|uniref:Uncharacterized protein n=1 Tax=Hyalomma asiaticum TaxID=266040 RepID=A0ACB7SWV7_HYAAI|nr:hypothetical protein HPB50_010182 [Hyalomma asiaticum]
MHARHCDEEDVDDVREPHRGPLPPLARGEARRSAGTSAGSPGETQTQVRALPLAGRLRRWTRKAMCSPWPRSASLNGRERRIRLSPVFFLGQKSASVRVPVRLSPTRLRDKDGRKTALARFDDAYPVDSASATFTPQRPPPYHKEGTDVFPGRIFSCGASSKGGWRQCLLRSKNA